jgi:hypothetical protein
MRYSRLEKVYELFTRAGIDTKAVNTEHEMRQNVARRIVAAKNN